MSQRRNIWFTVAGDDILVNSAVGRKWPTNLLRDPRFSFLVGDGYEWLGNGVGELCVTLI